jgi:WD40 repeat protein
VGHTRAINGVAFNRDGSRLATVASDRDVKLWDARTGKEVLTLSGHKRAPTSVCFSPDGQKLITSTGLALIENIYLLAGQAIPPELRVPMEVKVWQGEP